MKVDITPLAGYVLIEPKMQESKTMAGIYLPESMDKERPQEGIVLAISNSSYQDGREIFCPVKKGDKVIFKKWAGNDIEREYLHYKQFLKKKLLLIKFEDLMAVEIDE